MKAIYDSGLHHPLAAYLAAAILLAVLARRLPFLAGFLVVFTVEILADATVTGAWSPVLATSPWYERLSILFVILGDLRYFLLAERYTRINAPLPRVLVAAVTVSFAVPVLSGLASKTIALMGEPRVLFLAYEVALFMLVLTLQAGVYSKRDAPPAYHRFVRRLSGFVLLQYLGWALADCIILMGNEWGHLLRIVPNVLYYAAFLPFVYLAAPRQEIQAQPVPSPA